MSRRLYLHHNTATQMPRASEEGNVKDKMDKKNRRQTSARMTNIHRRQAGTFRSRLNFQVAQLPSCAHHERVTGCSKAAWSLGVNTGEDALEPDSTTGARLQKGGDKMTPSVVARGGERLGSSHSERQPRIEEGGIVRSLSLRPTALPRRQSWSRPSSPRPARCTPG